MAIPEGRCKRCKHRHACGITEIVSPDDMDELKRQGVRVRVVVRVERCGEYKRQW